MASWDNTAPTNLAAPNVDFSALGAIGDDYRKRQEDAQKAAALKAAAAQQPQPQNPALPVNPATGRPDYTAAPRGFFQAGNFPGLASGLTSFGNSVGSFLIPGGIGNPT